MQNEHDTIRTISNLPTQVINGWLRMGIDLGLVGKILNGGDDNGN